jgi:hypothetical protein
MSNIRIEVVAVVINRAVRSIDYNNSHTLYESYEFKKQTLLDDNSLTDDEKAFAIKQLNKTYDGNRIKYNEGTRRTCENCNQECLAISYCEYCVQNYIKANFSTWTSGNNDNTKMSIRNINAKCNN